MTTTLVLGATGKTGLPLVEQLLRKKHKVRVVVRSTHKLSAEILENPNATVIEAGVLDLSDEEMAAHVKGCDAVVSCLGHNLDFNGMFGNPRMLCTDATRRLCVAMEKNNSSKSTKFILMNSVGIQNHKLNEKRRWFEKLLLTVLRYTIPPHRDNETAAEHLHQVVGTKNKHVEWCAVRPDSLINAGVSPYEINAVALHGHLYRSSYNAIQRRSFHDGVNREAKALEQVEVSDACHYELQRECLINGRHFPIR